MLRITWIVPLVIALGMSLIACGGGPEESAEPAVAEPTATSAPANAETDTAADASTAESGAETTDDAAGAPRIAQEEIFAGALAKYGIEVGNYEVRGSTPGVAGQLTLDLSTATLGDNRFSVDLTGLKTDRNQRDEWIQGNGPSFARFPTAEFVATEIQNAPENYTEGEEANFQLVGDLTVREITQPVTFDVTATLDGDTIRGVATAPLRMSDFGIEQLSFANTLTVDDAFRVEVAFTAREE